MNTVAKLSYLKGLPENAGKSLWQLIKQNDKAGAWRSSKVFDTELKGLSEAQKAAKMPSLAKPNVFKQAGGAVSVAHTGGTISAGAASGVIGTASGAAVGAKNAPK